MNNIDSKVRATSDKDSAGQLGWKDKLLTQQPDSSCQCGGDCQCRGKHTAAKSVTQEDDKTGSAQAKPVSTVKHLTSPHRIELLAPAGTPQAFRAALKAGADAIYLGVDKFNARRNAQNFRIEDLPEICDQAHLSGVRVYLTLNIIIKEDELEEALDVVHDAYLAGIDGFIVQDWGLLAEIKHAYPEVECHISTQANVHDVAGVRFAQDMGAARVTTSRELSLAELKTLSEQGIDIEAFGHGALCICYSGQCLMSSVIGQRSANRGMCAQPCRLTYELVDRSGTVLSTVAGDHLLSPKDLSTIEILPELIASGVTSFKIEGRMKSPEYVGLVVSTYRKALDRALQDPENYVVSQDELDVLTEAFSRGFSTAYMEKIRSNEMMSYQRPNNRGLKVGRVARIDQGKVTLSLDRKISEGDILEYWTGRGRFAERVDYVVYRETQKNAKGYSATLRVSQPLSVGDRVFRVRNDALLSEIDAAVAHVYIRPQEIEVGVTAHRGKPLTISLTKDEITVVVQGKEVEAARTKAITVAEIEEHVGRFGSTPYKARSWNIDLDEGVGIGFSALHKLRAQACEELTARLLEDWRSRTLPAHRPTTLARSVKQATFDQRDASAHTKDRRVHNTQAQTQAQVCNKNQKRGRKATPELCALVSDIDDYLVAQMCGVDSLYLHEEGFEHALSSLEDTEDARQDLASALSGVRVLLREVSHDKDAQKLTHLRKRAQDLGIACTFVATNMSHFEALKDSGSFEVWNSIPAINSSVIALVAQKGGQMLWLSPELSLSDIQSLSSTFIAPVGIVVSGRQQVMVSEHCVLMSMGPCNEKCWICPRRDQHAHLKDRKGYLFPVQTDERGRCHIYNAVPLDITPEIAELHHAGVTRVMVDGTLLSGNDLKEEISYVKQQIACAAHNVQTAFPRRENTTAGHLYRGIK